MTTRAGSWARTAALTAFIALMISLGFGSGRRLFPVGVRYFPAALLGLGVAALLFGVARDVRAPDRARRRVYFAVYLLLAAMVIVMIRLLSFDGTSWLVAGATMALTLAVIAAMVRRSAR